jgi:phosphoribosylaminoimidazole-succinocarboxamide synthase
MNPPTVTETHLAGVPLLFRGKVRDIYDLGDRLLLVATDRISAFDVILPTPIPDKGAVLTGLSSFWFTRTASLVPNHYLTSDVASYPEAVADYRPLLDGRSMLVRRAKRIDIECVVRGYLAGSAWNEYRSHGTVGGRIFPPGLRQSQKLVRPIFTPTTKAETGHDESMSIERMAELIGTDLTNQIEAVAIRVYQEAHDFALTRGIILADTKLEFGQIDGQLIVIDELLTPDSSRFWDAESFDVGRSQPSFDKQFVRDWLETSGWDKVSPAPHLPPDVVERTSHKYREAYRRLVGTPLPGRTL